MRALPQLPEHRRANHRAAERVQRSCGDQPHDALQSRIWHFAPILPRSVTGRSAASLTTMPPAIRWLLPVTIRVVRSRLLFRLLRFLDLLDVLGFLGLFGDFLGRLEFFDLVDR